MRTPKTAGELTEEERKQRYIAGARDYYRYEEFLSFDNDPIVSESDEGAWVQAWVWVDDEDAGIEYEEDE